MDPLDTVVNLVSTHHEVWNSSPSHLCFLTLQVTLSEPAILSSASKFQSEPVEGRKVSKVIKTTVVHGERTEKHLGDASLASDLPSAKEDFEEVITTFVYYSSTSSVATTPERKSVLLKGPQPVAQQS